MALGDWVVVGEREAVAVALEQGVTAGEPLGCREALLVREGDLDWLEEGE